ncbi:MAG: tyrosine--tRNA ligase [Candidatus Sungbacteria bacterium]|nr:tyrosine--tRNA ligase [Candidatus Sungbacteria bacterium]
MSRTKGVRREDFFSFVRARAAEIIGAESLKRKLGSGRELRVKLGIDPTAPDLHLGHIVPLRMLAAFQKAGHRAVLIIGDFTAQIGDPSGKSQTRRGLSPAETKINERAYRHQIGRVLDVKKAEVRHNREWFGRMRLENFLGLLSSFSLKSAWQREDFQKRLKSGKEVGLHEAMYHVLQAYDSVMVRADVELGSCDQRLNILAGRELQNKLGLKSGPQDVVLLPYLIGLDGHKKMSKSLGNTINIGESAEAMFGKVMSIPDNLIINYAELAAWLPTREVRTLEDKIKGGANPRDAKMEVAEAVTALWHGPDKAQQSRDWFAGLFSKKDLSQKLPGVRLKPGSFGAVDLVITLKAAGSKAEARRLIKGRALEVDGKTVALDSGAVDVRRGSVIRVGKKKFFRVV